MRAQSGANNNGCSSSDKYALRPRALRGRQESRARRQPAPLSKYRRKTANARERTRMREINHAFETLRRAVPLAVASAVGLAAPSEKLTKITTLRLAMRYIGALHATLTGGADSTGPLSPASRASSPDLPPDFSSDCADDSLSSFDSFLAEFNYIDRAFT